MVSLYFGLPGCGKTTFATYLAVTEQKKIERKMSRYKYVYTNFPVFYPGILQVSSRDLGKYNINNALVIIDEASLVADSRDYKKFSHEMKFFFLMHRHWRCDVILFTQQWDAVDKKIRVITDHVYYVHKGALRRWISYSTPIPYGIIIPDKKDNSEKYGEIIQGYCRGNIFTRLLSKRIRRRKYYKYFDSYITPDKDEYKHCEWVDLIKEDIKLDDNAESVSYDVSAQEDIILDDNSESISSNVSELEDIILDDNVESASSNVSAQE